MQSKRAIDQFQKQILDYYQAHGRHDLPWRIPEVDGSFDAYKILVSEMMLQQTQVTRVIPKYQAFLARFPTIEKLAEAELGDVLRAWSGLGYNRRAKYLYQAVALAHAAFGGKLPQTVAELITLPGVGYNTGVAIMAYAYDQPVAFIETNVRTVFIHHFFNDQEAVNDKAILELVTATLPADSARIWYWSLMDYGAYLKQTIGNPNRASQSYAKQSTFVGSKRQVRGQVLRLLSTSHQTPSQLKQAITDERLQDVLAALEKEGLIRRIDGLYTL